MHTATFEEVQVPKDEIEDFDFLVDGQEVKLHKFNGNVIAVELPKTYEYEIVSIDRQKIR
jgi:translation elongation factor P/translation initiation factor 5A